MSFVRSILQSALWAAVALLLATCAGEASLDTSGGGRGSDGFGGAGGSKGGNGTPGASGGVGPDGGVLPPEREIESTFEVPVATGRYVWIANPLSGRVAYVDATTLEVKTVEAGNAPTYLASIPKGGDAVIVLNVLSHDATVLRAQAGRLTSTMVRGVTPLANAWAMSPDGRYALAWTDARRALADLKRDSLEGFQSLTAIDLGVTPPRATTVAVGYRPVSVAFSSDSRSAYVVTEDGVSVLALPTSGDPQGDVQVVRDVALTDDPSESADTRDVTITPDGQAIVRREGGAEIRFVNLASGVTGKVTLSAPVTDLDVTPEGTRAVAVVRNTSEVAILPVATAVSDPSTIVRRTVAGELIGSVVLSSDGTRAVLYSNAIESDRIVVVDLATGGTRIVRVHAAVLSVVMAADSRHAVVLHQAMPAGSDAGVGGNGTSSADGGTPDGGARTPTLANAFSIVPLDGTRSGRIQETMAPPRSVAFSPASDRGLVTVRDDRTRVYGVYVVSVPGLDVTRVDLASPPISTGVVATANRGYVAQSHADGRITFISFSGGPPQTLTGFDLGSRIVDGVKP